MEGGVWMYAPFIYLLDILGLKGDEIDGFLKGSRHPEYVSQARTFFTEKPSKKGDGSDWAGMLRKAVDKDMILNCMEWMGLMRAIDMTAADTNVDRAELVKLVDERIDSLLMNPTRDFYRFCFLIYMFQQKMTAKEKLVETEPHATYFREQFGLDLSSLLPSNNTLLYPPRSGVGGMPLVFYHKPHRWKARYLGHSAEGKPEPLLDAGMIVNLVAVDDFLRMKVTEEGTTVWNGAHTRVESCVRDYGVSGQVTINTCETDYISLLATNYGLLKGSGRYRDKLGTSELIRKAHTEFNALVPKKLSFLKEENGEVTCVQEAAVDFEAIETWDAERLERVFRTIDKIAANEHRLTMSTLSQSHLANCLSVNIAYRHGSKVYVQLRGNTGHGAVRYQISAAGFVELPFCCTDQTCDRTPDIMKAVRKESMEELLRKGEAVVAPDTMQILGIVRDNTNCEVGVLLTADISPKTNQEDVLGDVTELGAEVKGYVQVDAMPVGMYNFILDHASMREKKFKPWNDMMPLGAAALLFSMIRWCGDDLVHTAYLDGMKRRNAEKEKRV
jgi:hypothetical protein